jgi:DNA-binding GntR family transcriptional regulator
MSGMANLKTLLSEGGGVTRSLSLAEDAAQTIRGMILLEKLPPGTALPERDLAEALGVSRTPMREAIRLLAGEGLVQYTASRRPYVADPSLEEICDYLRVQGALEALAGELACAHASDAELREIDRLNRAIAEAAADEDDGRLAAFKADMEFHEAIVRAAGNDALIDTHQKYNARLWRARFMSSQRKVSLDSTRAEHAAIVSALRARDGAAASAALKQHLKTAEANIAQAMAERRAMAEG